MSGFGSITEYFRGGRGGGGPRGGGPRGGGPRGGGRGGGGRGGPRPRGGGFHPRDGRHRGTRIIGGTPHYSNYRPFGYYGGLPYYGYYGADYIPVDTDAPRIEPNWVGKRLVRIGNAANPEEVATGVVVLEANIPYPYVIIGPGQMAPGGYDSSRLQVYVDINSIITSVIYA